MIKLNNSSSRSPAVSRRGFWLGLFSEALSLREEIKGIPQCSLDEIGRVPEAVAAEMVPVWMNGHEPDIRPDGIYRSDKDGRSVCVLTLAPREKAMLAQYDCGRNLRVISRYMAGEYGLTSEEAFDETRELFVRLCLVGLCHPAAAHIIIEGGCDE